MSQPTVTAICLTKDRPEMLARAVRCFQAQTYEHKRLIIYDQSEERELRAYANVVDIRSTNGNRTIGTLRNDANAYADSDILVHWDDDDLSHENRIAEQVALLQASGADCVGYSDMLFWDTRAICSECRVPYGGQHLPRCHRQGLVTNASDYRQGDGEAWLYLGPQKALGTSLAYWRRVWEAKPFPDQPRPGFAGGEDSAFIKGLNLVAVSSIDWKTPTIYGLDRVTQNPPHGEPRMIASIHGRNTSGSYKLMDNSDSWRRVPEWDSFCRERMAL